MACQQELRKNNLPYPRTCMDCGLGPCKSTSLTDAEIDTEIIRNALRKAFALGQTYWMQADSESYKQNAKANTTRAEFEELINKTLTDLSF